uniref:Malonyl CoA-acyl carrier protein transacylase n=2 Tax=Planktothrix paucivesiculata PCC 9631 TaxID=671071 RepID=A0A0K0PDA6_9CYAN|nr:malonyl CoA-acyl carrier protein transacylase [Planktothrix paucivesiculata PCC 9631]
MSHAPGDSFAISTPIYDIKLMTSSWIIKYYPNPQASLRLFCFPYAGAGASIFRSWSTYLPPDIEACGIQLPGRENRYKEKKFTNIFSLIDALTTALLPNLDRPFMFFGHSVGALLSFAVARQLRRLRYPTPLHLFISSYSAPQLPNLDLPIAKLSDTDLLEEIRLYNGTPSNILENQEFINFYLPIMRADLTLKESYVYLPEPPLNCPISVFGGINDPKISRDSLASWQEQTSKKFNLQMFSGDHFYLKTQQESLLKAIVLDLTKHS